MTETRLRKAVFTAFLLPALALLTLSGCGTKDKAGEPKSEPKAVAEKKGEKKEADDGWWCKEHGVPEHDCAQCDAKVAAEYKKKGDWCKEHDRPESQCFICNPKRAEKFAAAYKAKYGKEPPPLPPEEKGEKK
ncbi:MAG: RND transporter [Planctomycetaceae bacterium]|nr:RND transporter [Planctomycetaceae bacterium]